MAGWGLELVKVGAIAPALLRQLREDLAISLAQPVWVADREQPVAEAFSRERQSSGSFRRCLMCRNPRRRSAVVLIQTSRECSSESNSKTSFSASRKALSSPFRFP